MCISETNTNRKVMVRADLNQILLLCYKHKANFSLVSCSAFCGLLATEPYVTSQTKWARLRDLLMVGFQVGKAICQSIRNPLSALSLAVLILFAAGLMALPSLTESSSEVGGSVKRA